MTPTNISSGGAEIISSGLIIQFNKKPIEINVQLPDFSFTCVIKFENKLENKVQSLHAEAIPPSTLSITFFNFNNPLGSGSSEPLNIGSYKNKSLYLSYRIYSLSENSDKTLHYTIYLTEEQL
jgi:hypothetical protein